MAEVREKVVGYVLPEVKIALVDAALGQGRSVSNYVGWLLTNAIKGKLTSGGLMKVRATENMVGGRAPHYTPRVTSAADASAIPAPGAVPVRGTSVGRVLSEPFPQEPDASKLDLERRRAIFAESCKRFRGSSEGMAMSAREANTYFRLRLAEFNAGLRDECDDPPGPVTPVVGG